MSRIMAPWIQYMRKKCIVILCKAFFQVLMYHEQPKAATTYKDFKLYRSYIRFSECSDDSKKCRVRIIRQVEAYLPSQTVLTVLVIFLDIWSAAVSKTIIDTEIYDKDFDYFVKQVLEVRKKIAQNKEPSACATEAPSANSPYQEHHQDDATQAFDSDYNASVETTVHNNEENSLARERENCILRIKQPVDQINFLIDTYYNTNNEKLKK